MNKQELEVKDAGSEQVVAADNSAVTESGAVPVQTVGLATNATSEFKPNSFQLKNMNEEAINRLLRLGQALGLFQTKQEVITAALNCLIMDLRSKFPKAAAQPEQNASEAFAKKILE